MSARLTDAMRRALTECKDGTFISAWELASSTIGALKRRGLVELDPEAVKRGFRGTYYRITPAGRAVLKEGGE